LIGHPYKKYRKTFKKRTFSEKVQSKTNFFRKVQSKTNFFRKSSIKNELFEKGGVWVVPVAASAAPRYSASGHRYDPK